MIPDGMVKGPERVLPRNSVFNGLGNSKSVIYGVFILATIAVQRT